jgi:hypothetical protein
MERSVMLGILALGVLGWLAGLSTRRSGGRRVTGRVRVFYFVAAAALAIVAGLVWPGQPVWKAGAPWGSGVVFGGIGALLAAFTGLASRVPGETGWVASASAPFFAATATAAATLLWLRADVVAALVGAAAGWVAVSLITGVAAGHARAASAEAALPAPLAIGAGFAITVYAAAGIGHYRDTGASSALSWSGTALLLAVGVPVLMLVVGLLASSLRGQAARGRPSPGAGWWAVLAGALFAGYAVLIGERVLTQPRFGPAAAAGLVATLVVWWLVTEGAADSRSGSGQDRSGVPSYHVLAVLVMLAATIAAFYLLIGYGVGVMLLAAWLPAGLSVALAGGLHPAQARDNRTEAPQEIGSPLTPWLYFGVIVLLYRLFLQRFETDLAGAILTDHFAIFTFIAGAFIPALLAGVLVPAQRVAAGSVARSVLQLVFTAVLAAAVPGALLLLWGPRAALGLLAGLMLSAVMTPLRAWHALLAVAVALPMMQWAHDVVRLSDVPRADKVRALIWLAAVVLAVIAASDYGQRVVAWVSRRRATPVEAWHRGG